MSNRKRSTRRVINIEDDNEEASNFALSSMDIESSYNDAHIRGSKSSKIASTFISMHTSQSNELITQFCSVISSDPETAKRMLQIADNNVELAVQLYLEEASQEQRDVHSNPVEKRESIESILKETSDIDDTQASISNSSRIVSSHSITEPFRDLIRESLFMENETIGSNISSERVKRLADLFRPPFELMYRGTLNEARNLASIQNRWLMIDIQNSTEFSCQAMNRDIWRNDSINGIVQESFLFMQWNCETSNGRRYITYYPVEKYPHISILDPRTGERVKIFVSNRDSHLIEPQEFLQEIFDFLEDHSLIDENSRSKSTLSKPSAYNINPSENTEPNESDSNGTRIQFRLADGSRKIRRFLKSDTIQSLFSYVMYICPELTTKPFDLLFMQLFLKDKMNSTLKDVGILNAVLTVSYIVNKS